MRAGRVSRFGGPEVVEIADVPAPRPRAGEVLVALRAAGLNRADVRPAASPDRLARVPRRSRRWPTPSAALPAPAVPARSRWRPAGCRPLAAKGEPVLGGVGRRPGRLLARQQLGSFLFAALPGSKVHHERRPAQRAAVEHRRPMRTGTRRPSRCRYSFSYGRNAPVRPICSTASSSAWAHSGGVIASQVMRPASRPWRV